MLTPILRAVASRYRAKFNDTFTALSQGSEKAKNRIANKNPGAHLKALE